MRMKVLLVCPLLIVAAVAAAAPHKPAKAELPATLAIPPFSMQYQVLRNGWHMGDARFTLERDGDVWQFRSEAEPAGLAALFIHSNWSESSRFRVRDRLLRPLVYAYTDSGHPDHNETISFDWDDDRAHDIRGGKEKLIPIASGMLDRLTAQLEISRELSAGVPLTEPYLVVKGGEINAYHLRRDGQKKIDTPTGRFDTTVVVREDPDSHSTTVFWLAPQYRWLPVKIEQRQPGEATYSFVLTHLQWLKQEGRQ